MDYDLARLGEREFEHLSQALALRVLGPGVQVFGDGPDGGREASFEGAFEVAERVGGGVWSGYGVLQAKFRRRPLGTTPDARWFAGQVEAELTRWSDPESQRVEWGRLPEYLLLTTNVVLSPTPRSGGIDVVDRLIARHADRLGLRGWEVWHYDKLCRLLDGHDQIRRAYASLLLPGDLLSQLQDLLPDTGSSRGGLATAHAANGHDRPAEQPEGEPDCPYKGLAAFTELDAAMFFGREQLTARLVNRLARRYRDGGPVVLLGASGAGKSSLLAAGLLPALRRGQLGVPGSADWPRLLLTPSADPLTALASAIAGAIDREPDGLAALLQADPGRLARWLHEAGKAAHSTSVAGGRHVLIIDQFEEVFTQCMDDTVRQSFIDAICTAAAGSNTAEPAAIVVIGIRADFAARLAAYPRLRESLETQPVLVGPMSRDELRCAIEQPAAAAGLALEPGLVDFVLDDVGTRPAGDGAAEGAYDVGRLPLLSHALFVTYQRSRGTHLTLASYRSAGGIRRALASSAEDILAQFDEVHRETARGLLLDLVQVGDGADDSRRRLPLARLLAGAPHPERRQRVLAALAAPDARLVTIHEDTVEITHEALLHAWPSLRGWIDADRAGQLTRQRLEDDANVWHDGRQDPGHLYQETRLTLALEWASTARNQAQLSPRARAFLDAGRRHGRRRRLRAITVLTVLLLVVTSVGATALVEWRGALRQRNAAEDAQVRATVEALLARADTVRDTDPRAALRLTLAANKIATGHQTRSNLLETLIDTDRITASLTGHDDGVLSVAVAPDGATLATGSDDGTVILWDVTDRAHPRPRGKPLTGPEDGVRSVAFTPDGATLAAGSYDGTVILWDVTDQTHPHSRGKPLTGHKAGVVSVAFAPDGATLATGSDDGTAMLWDVRSPDNPQRRASLGGHTGGVLSVAFTPDSATLATADRNSTLILWDVTDPGNPRLRGQPLTPAAGSIWSVAFSPDGVTLAIGSTDGTVSLWDVSDPANPRSRGKPLDGHIGPVFSVAFSPHSGTLAVGSLEGTVILWDITEPANPRPLGQPLTGHTGNVWSLAFTPTGDALATGSDDATAILWDVTDPADPRPRGQPLTGRTGPVFSVAFTSGGKTLATGFRDGTVILWDVTDRAHPRSRGKPLTGHENSVWSVAFTPDGATLVIGSIDGAVSLWNVEDPANPRRYGLPIRNGSGAVYAVAFTSDGSTLAVGGVDSGLTLWDVTDPATPRLLSQPRTGDSGPVFSAAFTPDGATLVAGSADRTVSLWDVTDPATPRPYGKPFTPGKGDVWATTFTADGHTLATSSDGVVLLWDVTDPAAPRRYGEPLTGHTGNIWSAAFTSDGHILATGSLDGSVILWDVTDRAAPYRLGNLRADPTDSVYSIAFTSDGATLAAGSNGRSARLWDITRIRKLYDEATSVACQRAGRGLDHEEWERNIPDLPYRNTC
jgi:WD40 repeat protein